MSLKLIFKDSKFSPLFWTQFFGALNDNLLKNALVVMITFQSISVSGLSPQVLVPLCSGIFILPFFLFSSLSGQLADKMQKATIARWVKVAELGIMLLAGLGFYQQHYWLLIFCLFLMGLHSAVFGPIKYSIIPELVSENDLLSGNAYVEVGTFLAILIGTIAGGLAGGLQSIFPQGPLWLTGALILISFLGILTSLKIPKVAISDPELKIQLNPFPEMLKNIRQIYPQKAVFNSILGISWFWFFGAVLLTLLPTFTKDVLHGNEHVITLFLALFTIGIACGSILCEKLSFGRVEIGLVPPASLGMTIFMADLAWASNGWQYSGTDLLSLTQFLAHPAAFRLMFDLFAIAICGGVFTVPLYTLIQNRSPASHRSRVIATNNFINALFMVISSLLLILGQKFNLSIVQLFLWTAVLNLLVSFFIYSLVPEFTLRFFSWVLTHVLYRVRIRGEHHVPTTGPALLVCNHVTYLDWMVIAGRVKRPIRFVLYYKFMNMPGAKYFFTQAKVIPIAGKNENLEIFNQAFVEISEALRDGDLVCLFPEGMLTQTGELNRFRPGVEHILKQDPVPVIPMSLKGLWGSFFSHKDGKSMHKIPKRIHFPVELNIGAPVQASAATAAHLETTVRNLLEQN